MVFHSMLRNLMSLFTKVFSLYSPTKFLAILNPKSPANLVVEVGTRHSHQILLSNGTIGTDFNEIVIQLTKNIKIKSAIKKKNWIVYII